MNPTVDELIASQYDVVRTKLQSGTLFGKTINLEDVQQLVVAAYYMGKNEHMLHVTEKELKG